MRKKSLLLVVVVAVAAVTFSITGQEEPLPVVQPRADRELVALQTSSLAPSVVLAVEPIHAIPQLTLADAARANDYVSFDALYRQAKARGESVAKYDTLHELWSWSMADPIGAFYGAEIYGRLARAYPGFATAMAEYRIVDDRGNAFYPTSETRAFLLQRALEDRALEGRPAPRVQVAERAVPNKPVERKPRPLATAARATSRVAAPAPAPAQLSVAAPIAEAPAIVNTEAPAPAATEPETPIVAQAPAPERVPATIPGKAQPVAENTFTNRGILLLVIGLIGVGLLAAILRTPNDAPASVLPAAPHAQVEPFRKTPTPSSLENEEPAKPRATGSRG